MKRTSWIFAVVLTIALVATNSQAQSGMGMAFSRDILVGPFATGGVAMNAGTLDSITKVSSGFSFCVGGLGIVPISEDMALTLGLAYDSRAYSVEADHSEPGVTITEKADQTLSYFSIRPGFKFKSFQVGVGIGLPISAHAKANVSASVPSAGFSVDSSADAYYRANDSSGFYPTINTLVEIRAGFNIPIWKNDNNALALLIEGSYGFTKIAKDAGDTNNGPLATAQVGVAYLFDVSRSGSY